MISGFKKIRIRKLTSAVVLLMAVVMTVIMYKCIYPYEPQIDKYENVLVVDGMLTNLPGNCFVKLSRTYKYNSKPESVEKGAKVSVMDDHGNEVHFRDKGDGYYMPEDSLFAGVIGYSYKLHVEAAGGEICESSQEVLTQPIDIRNIYYTIEDKGNGVQGLQIYLDTWDPDRKSHYYSWDYEETWEFSVPFQSMSIYYPEAKICYRHNTSRKISIQSTKEYSDDRILAFPLFFIDNTTNRLSAKYSVLVKQYVLTEQTYEFFRQLKDINENTGTLFDRTPEVLIGNMTNTLNPEQPVLGNFQVSGASEKRIFITRDELPSSMIITTEFEYCDGDLLSKRNDFHKLDSLLHAGWAVMDTIYDDITSDTLIGLVTSRACFDCRQSGSIVKPDYWDNK